MSINSKNSLFRKRVVSMGLVLLMLFSAFASVNVKATGENVFVDGYITEYGTGTPIAGATVLLQGLSGSENWTISAPSGYYNLSLAVPSLGDTYTVTVFHNDYLTNSTSVFLSPWNNQTVNLTLSPATQKNTSVYGNIIDAVSMLPIPSQWISALGEDYINNTVSNATGAYWMELQSSENYTLVIDRAGYMRATYSFYAVSGDNISHDFLLEPSNCTLSGYLKNFTTTPENGTVRVYRLAETGGIEYEYRPVVNQSTGYFSLNLSRGIWQVEASAEGYFPQTLTALLFNGGTTWQNFTLAAAPPGRAAVEGYVIYYDNGTGVPSAMVYAENSNGTWSNVSFTNESGWYKMDVIPGSKLSLTSYFTGYMAESQTLTPTADNTYFLNISMSSRIANTYMEGTVFDNGTGEPNVTVSARFGWQTYSGTTDSSGYYNISVPAASLDVSALKDGFKRWEGAVNTSSSLATYLDIDIYPLDWTAELRGYLTDNSSAAPLNFAFMNIDYGSEDGGRSAFTDYTGLFQMIAPAGNASYFAFMPDYEYITGGSYMREDNISWINSTMDPIPHDGVARFHLTDIYTGAPLAHVVVCIKKEGLNSMISAETNESGWVTFSLPVGIFGLSFDAASNGFIDAGTERDRDTMPFLLEAGETGWFNLSFYPSNHMVRVHGYVNGTTGTNISGASVSMAYGSSVRTVPSNSSGYYELLVPSVTDVMAEVRAGGYTVSSRGFRTAYSDMWMNFTLKDAGAWIEGPLTDSVADLDLDSLFDILYVNLTVNASAAGNYHVSALLKESRGADFMGLARVEEDLSLSAGQNTISLEFRGEQIRASGRDGYYVQVDLWDGQTYTLLDSADEFTASYTCSQFDTPDAHITTPVDRWLVDTDYDGLYNLLTLNLTINASVPGDYYLLGSLSDIWGGDVDQLFQTINLSAGSNVIQVAFDGTAIYNNGKNLGMCSFGLYKEPPVTGTEYIDNLPFYVPYDYTIFQHYNITSYVSGRVTDAGGNPIEGIDVLLYNVTHRYLNRTFTNATGEYELGGWGGEWFLVVDDEESDISVYQGNLSQITLTDGTNLTHDVLNLPFTSLDEVSTRLSFSDWNNTYLDRLLNVLSDNETRRFNLDVLEIGNGDGFVSEDEASLLMGMLGGMGLPQNSTGAFTVDNITYDLRPGTDQTDIGVVGYINSTDPIYIHSVGNYTANTTIPAASQHELGINCTYDDSSPHSITDNNATFVYYISPPGGWGRTGNGSAANVSITGTDFITADPLGDPTSTDTNDTVWVNITVSQGISPLTCSIQGNVTLDNGGSNDGVIVTVYDNSTGDEVASAPTDYYGFYFISGLPPGTYDVVAHKAGYADNRSDNHALSAGDTLWLDFTLHSYPPVISTTPVSRALVGDSIEIYADVTDDGTVDSVILYYQEVGSSFFTAVNMTNIASTSTYVATIPSQSASGYLYYYIWANDTVGNSAASPSSGSYPVLIYELDPPEIMDVQVVPEPAEYPSPVNISANITDLSGVDTVSLEVTAPGGSTTNTTMLFDASAGRYYLNGTYTELGVYNYTIWANDTFDNWNSSSGNFTVQDTMSPVSSVDPSSFYWTALSPVTINATAYDSGPGISYVELWYRYSADNASWGPWTLFAADASSPYQWSFGMPAGDGYYEFFSLANDSAGNYEGMKGSAETAMAFDSSPPSSNVSAILPYWQTGVVQVEVNASDGLSGISSVGLWYRYSPDNASWGAWTLFDTDVSSPYQWSFDTPDGDGYYQFYSIASDILNNTEAPPSSGDAACGHDSAPPEITLLDMSPNPCELGGEINISLVADDLSGIGTARVHIRLNGQTVGNYSMSNAGNAWWFLYSPADTGEVNVTVWVSDINGLVNSSASGSVVRDTTPPVFQGLSVSPASPAFSESVNISVHVSDISGISACMLNITGPGGQWLFNRSMASSGDLFHYVTAYEHVGTFVFSIWVEDNSGVGASLTGQFSVSDPVPPTANAGPPRNALVGDTVVLDAGLSTDNYGIENYTWTFDDNGLKRLYGEQVRYNFTKPGVYEITLLVTDFSGNSDSDTTWVNVSAATVVGTVTGIVLDDSGSPVSGATVYIQSDPTIRATTDEVGSFVIRSVPAGEQTVVIVLGGYQTLSKNITVLPGATNSIGTVNMAPEVSGNSSMYLIYAAIGAIAAVIALLLTLFLMKKRGRKETLIDELFFMYRDGRLIKHFTRRLRPDMDQDILSSMLVAVQDFVKDSFGGEQGSLSEMKFGRFQILLERGKYIILAAVILGEESEPFRPQLKRCIEDIEEKYGDLLENWDGNMESVEGTFRFVMDLIDGKYEKK